MAENNKIALVTGAGSGIGKHTALAFLADNYTVILTGRRLKPLKAVIKQADVAEDRAIAVSCDVSDPLSVSALFAEIEQRFSRLDVLFNNAGVNVPTIPIGELTFEQWKNVIDINLNGAFLCTRAAFNLMAKQDPQGGRIINNGSISAHVPRPGSAPYTASKHAITGLTRSTSLDGRAFNIACSQIDIGNAASEMTTRMVEGILQPNGTMAPESTMDVEHVANAVVHMAGLPLDANVQFMTIMATTMPFIGRG
jgi:NAD(P)-dependent dehydrogenase (short-subunit alcohol dehydrogenase family)